jgi:phenylacetate-CoA ligase
MNLLPQEAIRPIVPAVARAPAVDPQQTRLSRLDHLLRSVWAHNSFYACKWRQAGLAPAPLASLADLASFPLTTRGELLADQAARPPLGTNLTGSPANLKRFHRSSGTTRAPLLWADSPESWPWVLHCSQRLWLLAGVRPADRILFLMPFGASSGPWISYEGACRLGCACLPVAPTEADDQLHWATNFRPTVLAGKPSVLHSLAMSARAAGIPTREMGVDKLILCGVHGMSLRSSLEHGWAAECFDRYGITEAGSVAGECPAHSGGLHLLDDEFIAESVHPESRRPVPDGEPGELVLTTLGRLARPIIRYCTGDLVRLIRDRACPCGRHGSMLLGGVRRLADGLTAGRSDSPPPRPIDFPA